MAVTAKTYLCQVDLYRNGFVFRGMHDRLYDRNTKGSYLVSAKSPKEARKILQKAIGFGSITIPTRSQYIPDDAPELKHGEIVHVTNRVVEKPDGNNALVRTYDRNIRHATAPVE